jgi:thymidylate synthase (FAD)
MYFRIFSCNRIIVKSTQMDKYFRIELLRATQNPQQLCWLAMHQDYSAYPVVDNISKCPGETKAGEYLISHCIKFNHFGVLEHPSITFNCVGFPHHTVMQLRTHRVGISFDVSSMRYCSQHILDVANNKRSLEEVFCLRQPGFYTDRKGARYELSNSEYEDRKSTIYGLCCDYQMAIEQGESEEHAREIIPQSIRQNFVVSFNARSLLHVLDLRSEKNAQLEIQQFSELLFLRFSEWMPEIAAWYESKRLSKNRLAP